MPQMFDWIFFAIMIPFPAFLLWDFYRHREPSKRVKHPSPGAALFSGAGNTRQAYAGVHGLPLAVFRVHSTVHPYGPPNRSPRGFRRNRVRQRRR